MSPTSKYEGLGILWNYRNEESSRWLNKFKEIIENKKKPVWWDVGWRPPKLDPPIQGFIYTTFEQGVAYRTLIEFIEPQPDKAFVRKVEAEWRSLGLISSGNDPLHKYLDGDAEVLTLLQLSEIKALNPSKRLEDFSDPDGKPLSQPPPGFCYVILP